MASPNLPVNNDPTYADSSSDPSVKAHQQDHDKLAQVANDFDLDNIATTGFVPIGDGTVFKARAVVATDVSDSTATGRNVLKAADQAAARSAIGAGLAPTGTPGDGYIAVWDASTGKPVWKDPATLFAAANPSSGRLAVSAYPKYYHDTPIINAGETAPLDATDPIVFTRPSAANLAPTMLAQNSVQGASAVPLTMPEALAVGDVIGFAVGMSGDAATPPLGSVTVAFGTGAATVTWGTLSFPNGTAACVIGTARITTAVPSGTVANITPRDTAGAALARVHLLAGAFRTPGIAVAPLDVQQGAGGNSSANMAAITVAAQVDTAQATELAIACAVWNSSTGTVSRTLDPTGTWFELMERKSDNGASGRSLFVAYKQLVTAGKPVLTTQLTSNETTPATGQWAAALATLKAA